LGIFRLKSSGRQIVVSAIQSIIFMTEKNQTFPTGVQAVLLVVALLAAETVIGIALYFVMKMLGIDPEANEDAMYALTALLGNALIFAAVMRHKGLTYGSLFHATSTSRTAVAMLLVPAIALTVPLMVAVSSTLTGLAAWLFPMSDDEIELLSSFDSGTVGMVFMVAILAPVLEEMLFRGVILRSFLRQYPRWPAICGSAALFGCAHMNLYQYVAAVLMGIYLGWLYERTRSLLPCIALHATYNTASLLAASMGPVMVDSDTGMVSATFCAVALLLGTIGASALRRMLINPAR
jgi:membrane protease YdiL (CAAX protease family)